MEVVAEQLGHASIRVTKDVYGHFMPRSRANAAEAMRATSSDEATSSILSLHYCALREDRTSLKF